MGSCNCGNEAERAVYNEECEDTGDFICEACFFEDERYDLCPYCEQQELIAHPVSALSEDGRCVDHEGD